MQEALTGRALGMPYDTQLYPIWRILAWVLGETNN